MKKIIFVGNPNVGKSSLINRIAGTTLKVGNWNGVTTEMQVANCVKDNEKYQLTDLPGIYSLKTNTAEEAVAANVLQNGDYDIIINVIDSTNLERNLYLTEELKRLNKPMLVVLNFIDVFSKLNHKIDLKRLVDELDLPILTTVAFAGDTKNRLLDALNRVKVSNKSSNVESIIKNCVIYSNKHRLKMTEKIDNIVLHKYIGLPLLALSMYLFFHIVITGSAPFIDGIDAYVSDVIMPYMTVVFDSTPDWFASLIVDGIIGGLGGLLTFVPLMAILYVFLGLLEESGYMARVAFLLDRLMRSFGLSGKSFIPFLIGFGCSVPAIYSTRTIEEQSARRLTAMMTPFMSCGARLPVYMLFVAAFFPKQGGLIIMSMYIIGALVAFLVASMFKGMKYFKATGNSFNIELVPYHMPNLFVVLKNAWNKVLSYLKRASTIILVMMVLLWGFCYFPHGGDVQKSYLANFSKGIGQVLAPTGFANRWEMVASIVPSLVAKEAVVGFLAQVLHQSEDSTEESTELIGAVKNMWHGDPLAPLRSYSFMIFILLVVPCVVSLGALRQVFGFKFMFFQVVLMIVIPFIASTLVFNIGKLFF